MRNHYSPGGRIVARAVLWRFFAFPRLLRGEIPARTAAGAEERPGDIQFDPTGHPIGITAGPGEMMENDFRPARKALDAAQKDFNPARKHFDAVRKDFQAAQKAFYAAQKAFDAAQKHFQAAQKYF